ncbi:ribosome maturation factor RimP [Natronincola peptidivorans]|uniref:Ribosome maturation factor RimP n=1 Tax=Natronincola peptidivorans TaxID=426128 RepID=A0A1H9YHM8_9FIRM|nr:ribosome maturation factor RimP [Natronincola peptidivorans]SES68430.1 ribosome maturation factor RimP [Natronincola peptidivorans]
MGNAKIEKVTEELITPILQNEGFELVDIEFKKEGPHRYLRVYIDKPGGITLDDCQKTSEQLSDKLDEVDPIEENYFLEISSPGLDRPLKKASDFDKFKGEIVEVKLYEPINNSKVFEGELLGLYENVIKLNIANVGLVEIPKEKVAITKLAIKF